MIDTRLEKLASILVDYSVSVKPGDNVLSLSRIPAWNPILTRLL